MIPKRKPVKSVAIRHAARGEQCTGEIPGYCNADPETTVGAHLSFEGGKMGGKVSDVGGIAFLCSGCHDYLDRRTVAEPEAWDFYAGRALQRTTQRLHEKGVIKV